MGKIRRGGKNARSSPPGVSPEGDPSGTNLVIFLGALCAQTNLFWREMKIKKMYLKSNTQQENFRTFEKRDILNGIKSD